MSFGNTRHFILPKPTNHRMNPTALSGAQIGGLTRFQCALLKQIFPTAGRRVMRELSGGKENKKSPGNTGDYRRLKSEKEGEVRLELHVYAVQRLWQISQGWINGYQLHDSPFWK